MENKEKEIIAYTTQDGNTPFLAWLHGLRDLQVQKNILKRIDRVQVGNYGDYKSVGKGVLELRFRVGIRVYFAEYGNVIVLLLNGGNKATQIKDRAKAQGYWENFKKNNKGE